MSRKIEYVGKVPMPTSDGKITDHHRIKVTVTEKKIRFTTIEKMEQRKAQLEKMLADITTDIEAARSAAGL